MTKTISFINYKGGVGKTTTAYHIGCALALYHNKKVLMVDVDPQTNLTFLCVSPQKWEEFKETRGTLASLYRAFLKGDRKYDIKKSARAAVAAGKPTSTKYPFNCSHSATSSSV